MRFTHTSELQFHKQELTLYQNISLSPPLLCFPLPLLLNPALPGKKSHHHHGTFRALVYLLISTQPARTHFTPRYLHALFFSNQFLRIRNLTSRKHLQFSHYSQILTLLVETHSTSRYLTSCASRVKLRIRKSPSPVNISTYIKEPSVFNTTNKNKFYFKITQPSILPKPTSTDKKKSPTPGKEPSELPQLYALYIHLLITI